MPNNFNSGRIHPGEIIYRKREKREIKETSFSLLVFQTICPLADDRVESNDFLVRKGNKQFDWRQTFVLSFASQVDQVTSLQLKDQRN